MATLLPNSKVSAGITLVGILVAAFLLAVGAIAISRLSGSAEKFTGVGREITAATGLSREGLELVRAVRDNNWFREADTSHWLDKGLCVVNGQDISDSNRQIIIEPELVRTGRDLGYGDSQLYTTIRGAFTHTGGTKTPYRRMITIDCSTKRNQPQVVTVTSTVTWRSRGADRNVTLAEQLTNWLPPSRRASPSPTP